MQTTYFYDEWIHTKKRIVKDPTLNGQDIRILSDELTARWGNLRIRILKDYESDGASIPRLLWRVVGNPWEEYEAAAWVHDILYETEALSRQQADDCFLALMKSIGVKKIRRRAMWAGVRIGGGLTWKKHNDISRDYAKKFLKIEDVQEHFWKSFSDSFCKVEI